MIKKIYKSFLGLSKILSRKNIGEFINNEFSKMQGNLLVANIGAGGQVESVLREYAKISHFRVISLDIDPDRKPDIVCDITSQSLPNIQFDSIVMVEVLEHVTDPHAAVSGISRLLKPGGQLILTAPFIFPIHDRPHDYYRYTRHGLEYLFRDMDDLMIIERNSWSEAIGVLISRLIMEKSISARLAAPIAVILALLMSPIAIILSALIKTDFITSGYLLTCKKPESQGI